MCILCYNAIRVLDTMNPRAYWNAYVSRHGGPVGVAAHLRLSYSTVAGVCNGSRGIGRKLARKMAERDPLLDENTLIWVVAEKPRKAAGSKAEAGNG